MIRMLGASLNSRFEKGKRGTTLKWQKKKESLDWAGTPGFLYDYRVISV